MHPPFLAPLTYINDEEAWTAGVFSLELPPWSRSDSNLARHGVHWLLRAARLPEAELLHMGATRAMLSAEATTPLAVRWVAPLLGRIAWDARYGEAGNVYCSEDKPSVLRMGHDIIEAWFL
jgi:hypothetical protein